MASKQVNSVQQQLALSMQLNDRASFDDFCWAGNALLEQELAHSLSMGSAGFFYVWGAPGCGKSHLLQACCHHLGSSQASALYLPLKLLHSWDPAVLEGLESHSLVAIDDLEMIVDSKIWQEALFHLVNHMLDRQAILLISGRSMPAKMGLSLADLRSRLSGFFVSPLHELADQDKILSLQARARKRGFELPLNVGQYLLTHCARNMHDLIGVLERLDKASLVMQRKLSIPFVKQVLDNLSF